MRQVVSFRGNVADDIAKKLIPSTQGASLANALFHYVREHSEDLACYMEDDTIVIGNSIDCKISER